MKTNQKPPSISSQDFLTSAINSNEEKVLMCTMSERLINLKIQKIIFKDQIYNAQIKEVNLLLLDEMFNTIPLKTKVVRTSLEDGLDISTFLMDTNLFFNKSFQAYFSKIISFINDDDPVTYKHLILDWRNTPFKNDAVLVLTIQLLNEKEGLTETILVAIAPKMTKREA